MVISNKDDFELLPGATDGVSGAVWSPVSDYIAVSSWDGQTRIYEVLQATRSALPKAALQHDGPALAVAWSPDGTKVASVGADKCIKLLDIVTGQQSSLPNAHDAPIRCAKFAAIPSVPSPVLITGGWDRQVKYWAVSTGQPPQPLGTLQLPERCYAMDVSRSLLVVGCAERHLVIVDLSGNPTQPVRPPLASPLKMQTRAVACFPDGTGFVVGSVEGRCGVQFVDPAKQNANFTFKCHRDAANAYGVNGIAFHPVMPGTFATIGSDGVVSTWDKESKQRVDSFPAAGQPISTVAWSRNGSLLAYAVSYDWSKGHEHYPTGTRNAVMVHRVVESDIKPRQQTGARR